MALTRDFKVTIKERMDSDPEFKGAIFAEAIELLLGGDIGTSKAMLRNYINATVGFEKLGTNVGKSPKSLMRMFSIKGNPRADSLFPVISYLQESTGVHLLVDANSVPKVASIVPKAANTVPKAANSVPKVANRYA